MKDYIKELREKLKSNNIELPSWLRWVDGFDEIKDYSTFYN